MCAWVTNIEYHFKNKIHLQYKCEYNENKLNKIFKKIIFWWEGSKGEKRRTKKCRLNNNKKIKYGKTSVNFCHVLNIFVKELHLSLRISYFKQGKKENRRKFK